MDAFEIRIQFVNILRKLSSSQSSINRVVTFALKHGNKCADDLWDCLLEECAKASLNARINMFYALDSLLFEATAAEMHVYVALVKRDLGKIVDLVVPDNHEGVLNVMSTSQVLKSWKMKRVLDVDVIEPIEAEIERRRQARAAGDDPPQGQVRSTGFANFSRNDIFRRIEDDRERHKRLRERIWVLPTPASIIPLARPASLFSAPAAPPGTEPESRPPVQPSADAAAIDIEFAQLYESLDRLTEAEVVLMRAESARCFGEVAV